MRATRARVGCGAAALLLAFGVAPSAQALCIYGGKLYATTTITREFHDSQRVVRGRVVASRDHYHLDASDGWGAVYDVEVLDSFKGAPLHQIRVFTERNSGGFYLDVGRQYLLFLDTTTHEGYGREAPGAWVVNYNCGQSRAWGEVGTAARRLLNHLSHR